MKIAFISDIHANLEALQTVLDKIDELSVDSILCAGDIVGYYPRPNETVQLVKDRGIKCIAGNHDRTALAGTSRLMNWVAVRAIQWTHDNLKDTAMEFLRSLPNCMTSDLGGLKVSLFHGSPLNDDEYVNESEALPYLIERSGSNILVLGHTHVPYIRRFEVGMIINPGSVGQPRDGNPRASFAVLDSIDGVSEIRRVEYDTGKVADEVKAAGLPSVLGDRLLYGI